MKYKNIKQILVFLLILTGFLCTAGQVFAGECFQETANVSTDCGGLDTGSYTFVPEVLYINYTIPSNVSGAKFQIKRSNFSISNHTIYSGCLNKSNKLELSVQSIIIAAGDNFGYMRLRCNTDGGWYELNNSGIIAWPGTARGSTDVSVNAIDGDYNTYSVYDITHSVWVNEVLDEVPVFIYEESMIWTLDIVKLNLTFYDEETGNLINNVDLDIISDDYTTSTSTINGNILTENLAYNTYTLRYSATDYSESFYYITIDNNYELINNINLYLSNDSTASEITATVYDETNDRLEDVYIKVLRYDTISNSYTIRDIAKTNFEGETILNLILNDEFYKFILEYPLGTVKKTTSPTYIYDTSLAFQISLTEDVAEDFYNSFDVSYSLTFNNDTSNFVYTYSDSTNTNVEQGCLKIYEIDNRHGSTLINSTCTSGIAGSMFIGVSPLPGKSYRADTVVYFNGDSYSLASLFKSYPEDSQTGNLGVFLILIITIAFVFIGYWNKTVALVITPIPLMLGVILNFVDMSMMIPIGLELVCIIIAIWIGRK